MIMLDLSLLMKQEEKRASILIKFDTLSFPSDFFNELHKIYLIGTNLIRESLDCCRQRMRCQR